MMTHPLLNIAEKAALAASSIILQHIYTVEKLTLNPKSSPNDFATEVDIEAEAAIIGIIQNAYPDHSILAEESGHIKGTNEDTLWIIDPLDGTTNYVHGFPHFAVSIAIVIKNRVEHAVVYHPLLHECFRASRGRGATVNNRKMRISKNTEITHALIASGLPFRHPEQMPLNVSTLQTFLSQCRGIRRTGSAALDLAYVAAGRLDGAWDYNLKSWDIAAGSLLIQESGGLISDFKGDSDYLKTGNIVAGSPKIFKALLQAIHGAMEKPTL